MRREGGVKVEEIRMVTDRARARVRGAMARPCISPLGRVEELCPAPKGQLSPPAPVVTHSPYTQWMNSPFPRYPPQVVTKEIIAHNQMSEM